MIVFDEDGDGYPRHLGRCVIPGRAAGSKNSQAIHYPRIRGLDVWLQGRPVFGLKQLFQALRGMAASRSPALTEILERCGREAMPAIANSTERNRWLKQAGEIMSRMPGPRPLLPFGHDARVQTVVYLGKAQTGDLNNFEHGVWDALEDAGVIKSDHWINSSDGSCRRWDEPLRPRVEVDLYDLGPRVKKRIHAGRVFGLAAAADKLGPPNFRVEAEFRSLEGVAAKGISREVLIDVADLAWQREFGESLPRNWEIRVS